MLTPFPLTMRNYRGIYNSLGGANADLRENITPGSLKYKTVKKLCPRRRRRLKKSIKTGLILKFSLTLFSTLEYKFNKVRTYKKKVKTSCTRVFIITKKVF